MEKATKKDKSVRAVPEGFQTITPFLVANHAEMLIDFLKKAFDGELTFISKEDSGKIMHATVKIGDSTVMIADAMENNPPASCMLHLYVDDVDSVYKEAVKAKAISIREPLTEFYGDRAAAVRDAWNNVWWIATHVEDVDRDELEKRTRQFRKQQKESLAAHA